MSLIITPDHFDFSRWLAVPPPNWKKAGTMNFAIIPDSSILTPVTQNQLDELIIDAGLYCENEEEEEEEEESILVYPDHISEDSNVW